MKLFLLLITAILYGPCLANGLKKPVVIAVIDTGFGYKDQGHDAKLCKYGHKDFSLDRLHSISYDTKVPVPVDTHGHGTNVVGLIERELKDKDVEYCLVILKFYSEGQTGEQNLKSSIAAIKYAANIKARVINYSGGGPQNNILENKQVARFLNCGGIFVAAAGNENKNIDAIENYYYPAKYDKRIIVVGNLNFYGTKSQFSNFGSSVTRWEVGENQTAYGVSMSGTSQATAIATGKLVAAGLANDAKTQKCDR